MTYMQIVCIIAAVGSLIIGIAYKDKGIIFGSAFMLAVILFGLWASGTVF